MVSNIKYLDNDPAGIFQSTFFPYLDSGRHNLVDHKIPSLQNPHQMYPRMVQKDFLPLDYMFQSLDLLPYSKMLGCINK